MTILKFASKNKACLDASHRGWRINANSFLHGIESSVFIRGENFFFLEEQLHSLSGVIRRV